MAGDLRMDRPLGLTIAGERVVLFRDASGAPAALIDRCPHRGVALSLGCVRQGVIACPFHGWRFGADGRNLMTPWNPDAKREPLSAVALPARENGGLLWVHTAPGRPESEPTPPESTLRNGVRLCSQSVMWNAHWSRVMENMLDSPHVPFVHRRSFGGPIARLLAQRPAAKMTVRWEPQAYGAKIFSEIDGAPRPTPLDYRYPNLMELTLDAPQRLFRIFAVCIPVSDTQTRLMLITARSFLRASMFDALFRWSNRKIAEEDRMIVESSRPPIAPDPGEEHSVASDAGTLAFRRLYRQKLMGSRA